ncbi:MAG: hypothetical protein ACLQVD_22710 [Capsulimonadaceae bacterium]
MTNEMMTADEPFSGSTTTLPSEDYVHAISRFFDTDPSDMLVELGYYQRKPEARTDQYVEAKRN